MQVCGRHNGSHDEGEMCEALEEATATVNVKYF